MKKFFTLIAAVALAASVNAQAFMLFLMAKFLKVVLKSFLFLILQ
ncbi:MAG: hypothetical protein ACLTSS_05290 [Phocaeicola coprocola]